MSTIYLLGGPPRTAKSTIALNVIAHKAMPMVASDAVKAGLRNVLIDDPRQMLRSIEFEGWAEHKASVTTGGAKKPFAKKSNSEELTKQALLGMVSHYTDTESDMLIEGDSVTPEWATSLTEQGLNIKAAFVGYTSIKHIDVILARAKADKTDWINGWLKAEDNNDTNIRTALAKQADECQQLKVNAENHGFSFYDISIMDFNAYVNAVRDHLLN